MASKVLTPLSDTDKALGAYTLLLTRPTAGPDTVDVLGRGAGCGVRERGKTIVDMLVLLGIGLAFTLFAALVFSLLTLLLGKIRPDFEISGPDDWSFAAFYVRYLLIALGLFAVLYYAILTPWALVP